MYKPLELFVGLRYTRARRKNHFISFISLISMMGIALGVTALITVLSVMNGFEKELRGRILGMAAHVTVSGNGNLLKEWTQHQQKLSEYEHVEGAAPFIRRQVMLTHGSDVSGALVQGILPEYQDQVSNVNANMVYGSFEDLQSRSYNIALGIELAANLGVYVGDKITMVTPQGNVTPAGVIPRLRRFTVAAIYKVDMQEFDSAMAFIHMEDAARLFKTGDGITGVRLKLDDMFNAPKVRKDISEQAQPEDNYWLSDWTLQHANFFKAVKMEKTVMFFILMLIVAVAAFNLVSTLVMVVTDKQSDIAILRTLGLTPRRVMLIFMVQGSLIGMLGTAFGLIGGIGLALNVENIIPFLESLFNTQFLSPDIYYISEVPSDLHWEDVWKIGLWAFSLSILATLYPAWKASSVHPAESLRYE